MKLEITLIGYERTILEFLSLGWYRTSGKTDYDDHAKLAENAIRYSKSSTGNVAIRVGYEPAVVERKVVKKGEALARQR